MLGRVVTMFAQLGIMSLLTHQLDESEIAAFVLASFLVPFVATLMTFGSTDVLLRITRASHLESDSVLARSGFRACLTLLALSGALATLGFAILCRVLASHLPLWALLQQSMVWFLLWCCLYALSIIAAEMFRGRDQFLLSTAMFTLSGGWIMNLLALVAFLASAALADDLTLDDAIMVHVIASGVALVIGIVLYRRTTIVRETSDSKTSPASTEFDELSSASSVRWLARESWPVFIAAIAVLGIEQLDVVFLSFCAEKGDVANYGFAKRLVPLVNFAFVTLSPALSPFIAELYALGDMRRLERLLRGASTLIGIPCALICLAMFAGADLLVVALFGEVHAGAALPLRILLVGQAFLFMAGHANNVLIMTGRQRLLMRSNVVVSAVFAIFCPLASIWWGAAGAATAKSLATVERAASAAFLVKRSLGIWTTFSTSPAALSESLRLIVKNLRSRRDIPIPVTPPAQP
jgi:O-antigen/teichoic acid export membrane protein